MKTQSACEKVIRRDIARTYPEHDFFKKKDGVGQEALFNVMKAYSIHDREVGYCQGSAFIVGLLLMQVRRATIKPMISQVSSLNVVADAGGGGLLRAGQADAGVSDARDVQALHGRTGLMHVPAGDARPRTRAGSLRALSVTIHPHKSLCQLVVPHSLLDFGSHRHRVQVRLYSTASSRCVFLHRRADDPFSHFLVPFPLESWTASWPMGSK